MQLAQKASDRKSAEKIAKEKRKASAPGRGKGSQVSLGVPGMPVAI